MNVYQSGCNTVYLIGHYDFRLILYYVIFELADDTYRLCHGGCNGIRYKNTW